MPYGLIIGNRYVIEDYVGEGGGSVVYKAFDRNLQTYVVLKQMKGNIPFRDRRNEVDVLKSLKHQALPKVLDFQEFRDPHSGNTIYFTVMDLVRGTSFDHIMRQNMQFPQEEIIRWAREIANALAYLHQQNPWIIHSDLKPGNIMLHMDTGTVSVIDFNVSLAFTRGARDSVYVSPGYSPPEQYGDPEQYMHYAESIGYRLNQAGNAFSGQALRGGMQNISADLCNIIRSPITPASDIYSFGATFYHLLTGRKPSFIFGSNPLLADAAIGFYLPFLKIIDRCMCLDPHQRYQNGGELYYALTHMEELDEEYQKKQRRKKGIRLGILAVVVGSVLAGGLAAFSWRQSRNRSYQQQLDQAEACIEDENYTEAKEILSQCIEGGSGKADAYLLLAKSEYLSGNYEETIDLIQNTVFQSSLRADTETNAEFYYVLGNAYLESEEYQKGSSAFEEALELYEEDALYYRDYAVCLAKEKKLDQAEEALSQAKDAGLSDESIDYAAAEIAYASGDTDEALKAFEKILDTTQEEELQTRAILMISRIYGETDIAQRIDFLEEQKDKAPVSIQKRIIRDLAESYLQEGNAYFLTSQGNRWKKYYKASLEEYELLYKEGYCSMDTLDNMAIIEKELGEYDEGLSFCDEMIEKSPDNYRGYKRKAFLLAAKENDKSSGKDFSDFEKAYKKAVKLFAHKDSVDDEMDQLDELYDEIRENGWL